MLKKVVFLTTSLSIYNTNMIPVSANYLHCVISVYHRIVFLGEWCNEWVKRFYPKFGTQTALMTRSNFPELLCDPNVTAKGRVRITGHFGSGLVMPYPCFLSKDNQVCLIAMPVTQSRCLIFWPTIFTQLNSWQKEFVLFKRLVVKQKQGRYNDSSKLRTKLSHVIYYVLKIQKIRNASNYSSGLRAHCDLFFLLSAPTTLDVSRRMRRLKKLR